MAIKKLLYIWFLSELGELRITNDKNNHKFIIILFLLYM